VTGAEANPDPSARPGAGEDLSDVPAVGWVTSGAGAVRDSISVGTWTALSRGTGVVRVLLIAAVLGPTYLGNAYQLTNALPNLLFYGFLGGSLFASLLIPSFVGYLDRGSTADVERVAGGFLGVALLLLCVVAPAAVLVVPALLQLLAPLADSGAADQQAKLARLLLLMMVPQALGYAVASVCAASMNAQRRFALAAAAPAIENVAIVIVLLVVAKVYGQHSGTGSAPAGELLLLGLGSTAAVAVHAGLQWWGASRGGVRLRPRMGWRDSEVRLVVQRAMPSLVQSGLMALQVLALLLVASSVAGGTVAFQIALNFYALPISIVATPVALTLLPRLSRLVQSSNAAQFADALVRGLRLVLFLTLPAATGYLVLAGPIADTVAGGAMATADGRMMITYALGSIACGLVGQAVFFVAAQAAYARRDTRTPLRSMIFQTVACLFCSGLAVHAGDVRVLIIAGLGYSLANLLGAAHLLFMVRRYLVPGSERLLPGLVHVVAGCFATAAVSLITSHLISQILPGRPGATLAVLVASAIGLATFAAVQLLCRSQEARWLVAAITHRGAGAVTGDKIEK
jgi:putative peptidoglycan lipid II flippase